MRTIQLNVPLLVGAEHHPAGKVLDVDPVLAKRLVDLGHAAPFTRKDAFGSGTIEIAAVRPSPRKAARTTSG